MQLQDMKNNAAQGTTALAQQMKHPIQGKLLLLEQKKDLLGAGIPGHMLVEREIRSAAIALANSKDLQAATPASFYTAVSVAINSGIGLGRGQGYLVAYKGNCQFVPGWRGLVDLVTRSGRATVWTGVVRKGDHFEYALGDSPFLTHRPGESEEFSDITHYYSVGRVKGSEWPIIEVWSANKAAKHLRTFNKVGTRHYALKDDNNMEHYCRKVTLLQVIKYLPQSQEIQNALAAEAAHESGKEMTIEGNFVYVADDYQDAMGDTGPLAGEVQEDIAPARYDPIDQSSPKTPEEQDYERSMAAEQAAQGNEPGRRTRARTNAPE
jgi:recombination protein RecT